MDESEAPPASPRIMAQNGLDLVCKLCADSGTTAACVHHACLSACIVLDGKSAMGCGGSKSADTPATDAPVNEVMPESVAMFFNGEPMAGKAEKYMGEMVADSHTLAFVGPHAMPLPVLDKAKFAGAAGNLVASFPDLTFNFTKVAPTKNPDGSWSADIVVMGTNTGAAFTPMPGKLPPIETTGKCVKIGPETFTLWVDGEGKVCKTEITPLGAGHPHGPPGFYTEIGGSLEALA